MTMFGGHYEALCRACDGHGLHLELHVATLLHGPPDGLRRELARLEVIDVDGRLVAHALVRRDLQAAARSLVTLVETA